MSDWVKTFEVKKFFQKKYTGTTINEMTFDKTGFWNSPKVIIGLSKFGSYGFSRDFSCFGSMSNQGFLSVGASLKGAFPTTLLETTLTSKISTETVAQTFDVGEVSDVAVKVAFVSRCETVSTTVPPPIPNNCRIVIYEGGVPIWSTPRGNAFFTQTGNTKDISPYGYWQEKNNYCYRNYHAETVDIDLGGGVVQSYSYCDATLTYNAFFDEKKKIKVRVEVDSYNGNQPNLSNSLPLIGSYKIRIDSIATVNTEVEKEVLVTVIE